ncbi:fukutin-related protein [Anaeramoeba flamelloides]|uniref:Fukutin-related protein n=1 Tax=Anaeramoeba flamelloides TaxID=1746091 RepID=A0AAV8A1I9_9EUKA|nr:fukutin-related protein [Anaeramoeba flamelloides]
MGVKIKPVQLNKATTESETSKNLNDLVTFIILNPTQKNLTLIDIENFNTITTLNKYNVSMNYIVLSPQNNSDWVAENINTPFIMFIENGKHFIQIKNKNSNETQIVFKDLNNTLVHLETLIHFMLNKSNIDIVAFESWFPNELGSIKKNDKLTYIPKNNCKSWNQSSAKVQGVRPGKGWPKTCDLLTSSFLLRKSAISDDLGDWKPFLYQQPRQDFFFKSNKKLLTLVYYSHIKFPPRSLKINNQTTNPVIVKKVINLTQSGIIYMGSTHQRNGHLWIGCRNDTFRCDVGFIQRKTYLPPCCHKKLFTILRDVSQTGIREKHRIPYDLDEDISVLEEEWLIHKKNILEEIEAHGYYYHSNKPDKVSWSEVNTNYIDIYRYFLHQDKNAKKMGIGNFKHGHMMRIDKNIWVPTKLIFPLQQIKYHGTSFNFPAKPKEYLKLIYGENWHTPIPWERSKHLSQKCPLYPQIFRTNLCTARY